MAVNWTFGTQSQLTNCDFMPQIQYSHANIALIAGSTLTSLIATSGNFVIILTILNSYRLRENVTYIFVLSLSIADFLVGLVAQPLFIFNVFTRLKYSKVCAAGYAATFISCSGSINGIIGITLERFLYIVNPEKYDRLLGRKRAIAIIIFLWCIGISITALHVTLYKPLIIQASALALILASFIISLGANIKFLMLSTEKRKKDQTYRPTVKQSKSTTSQHTQITLLILKLCIAFGICWIPCGVLGLILAIDKKMENDNVVVQVYYWSILLGYSNSALNILIYGKGNTVLSCEVKRFLRLKKYGNNNSVWLSLGRLYAMLYRLQRKVTKRPYTYELFALMLSYYYQENKKSRIFITFSFVCILILNACIN